MGQMVSKHQKTAQFEWPVIGHHVDGRSVVNWRWKNSHCDDLV